MSNIRIQDAPVEVGEKQGEKCLQMNAIFCFVGLFELFILKL